MEPSKLNFLANGADCGCVFDGTRAHNSVNEVTGIANSQPPNLEWAEITHDAAGNMTSGPRPGAEDTRLWLRYDAWNRLTHVSANSDHNPTIAEYRYDGLDRRISKAIAGGDTFHYYYNENWQVLEVTKGSAAYEQYVWDARYIDAPVLRWRDANNSEVDGLEETLFYTNDANMNVTALVNESGQVVERYRYDAYGKVTFLAGAKDLAGNPTAEWTVRNASIADNQVLYCGYRFDPETGLYQVRFRMYHPTAGRWMQRDPAGYVRSANLTLYCRSSPVTTGDPTGLAEELKPTAIWWGVRGVVSEDVMNAASVGTHLDPERMKRLGIPVPSAPVPLAEYTAYGRPKIQCTFPKSVTPEGAGKYRGEFVEIPVFHSRMADVSGAWTTGKGFEQGIAVGVLEAGVIVDTGSIDNDAPNVTVAWAQPADRQCIDVTVAMDLEKTAARYELKASVFGVNASRGTWMLGNDIISQAVVKYRLCAWCQCRLQRVGNGYGIAGLPRAWAAGEFREGSFTGDQGSAAASWTVEALEGDMNKPVKRSLLRDRAGAWPF